MKPTYDQVLSLSKYLWDNRISSFCEPFYFLCSQLLVVIEAVLGSDLMAGVFKQAARVWFSPRVLYCLYLQSNLLYKKATKPKNVLGKIQHGAARPVSWSVQQLKTTHLLPCWALSDLLQVKSEIHESCSLHMRLANYLLCFMSGAGWKIRRGHTHELLLILRMIKALHSEMSRQREKANQLRGRNIRFFHSVIKCQW